MTESNQQRAFRKIKEKNGVLPSTHQVETENDKPEKGKFPKQHYSIKMFDTNGSVRVAIVEARNINTITQDLRRLSIQHDLLVDVRGNMFNLANIVFFEKPIVVVSKEND